MMDEQMEKSFSARGGCEYVDGWAVQVENGQVVLSTPVSDGEGLKDVFPPEQARKLGEALIMAADAARAG